MSENNQKNISKEQNLGRKQSEASRRTTKKTLKAWPINSPWPDLRYPIWGEFELEDAGEGEQRISWDLPELVEVKEYFEDLQENGIYFEEEYYDLEEPPEDWEPEIGDEFWLDRNFEEDLWKTEFDEAMSRLKLYGCDTAYSVERLIGYDFADEKLLQQAFIRRSFATEYGISACSEELEFFGDSALNLSLTRSMAKQYGDFDSGSALFVCQLNEGQLSKIKARYSCKEHLAKKASELGLDRFILYGTADEETESAKEDMMEAIIGAVAIDSDWNFQALDTVIDNLLNAHLDCPDKLLEKDFFDIFNSWHQKRFGKMPEYELYQSRDSIHCKLRYLIPENDKNLSRVQRIDVDRETRSKARSYAAETAYYYLNYYGLWMNLKDSGIDPDEEQSINQLQELYQKKYVDSPQYRFEDDGDRWKCTCVCDAVQAEGYGKSKTEAKKTAAFRTLCRLFQSAGVNKESWGELP